MAEFMAFHHTITPAFTHCDQCHSLGNIDEMDAKPDRFNRFWWRFLPLSFARWLLGRAADRGECFETVLCERCYGPGYERMGE